IVDAIAATVLAHQRTGNAARRRADRGPGNSVAPRRRTDQRATGPAGQRAAIQASQLGKKVCVIDRKAVVGGAALTTGTIPSKSLREAIRHVTAAQRQG
ncbi:hypothetical protein ABTM63_19300, partial [Acinetobacter baumannii]